jgi:hypothetical protein
MIDFFNFYKAQKEKCLYIITMETTKNKLTEYERDFFHRLGSYLDTKLYFYGSIQRVDYFPQSSDIDVDIFTDNESTTILKLMNFLNVEKSDFKNFVSNPRQKSGLVYGKKIMYKEPENRFSVEFSIYNEKDKDTILYEHNYKRELPFYITFLLMIIKCLYYQLQILPKEWYKSMKNFILNDLFDNISDNFVVIDIKKENKKTQ